MNGRVDVRECRDEIIDSVQGAIHRALPRNRNRDLPFITLAYAQSIDGSIARSDSGTLLLSNSHSQKMTHQIRSLHDAILVGINTVLCDDPRLNVRLVDGSNPQPIVVDSRLRFPLNANLLKDPCVRPIVVAGCDVGCETKERQLLEAGAQVVRMPLRRDGSINLADLLVRLKRLGLQSIMVEGGAKIITSVLLSNLADQFLLTIAPRFVGGLRALTPQDGDKFAPMPRLCNVDSTCLAGDLIIRGDFDPAANGSAAQQDKHNDDRFRIQPLDVANSEKNTESK